MSARGFPSRMLLPHQKFAWRGSGRENAPRHSAARTGKQEGTSGARPWIGARTKRAGPLSVTSHDPSNQQIPAFSWMRYVFCTCSTAGTL